MGAAESRSVVVRMSMDVANGVRAARQFGKSISDAANDAERGAIRADQALENVGNTAGAVGATAAAGLFAVGKAAMDWESQWAGVTKTVDGTTSQLAELEGGLRDLATSMPATHQEIAAVAEAAGQLGVERDSILSFTETMVQLGETTNLSADAAATAIAQMTNVMGTAPEDIDNLGAALVALGNDGASTEAQIIEMAQRISSAGALIGLAESDILAIANATASMGIEVEAGGSAISTVFMELAKSTKTGGESLTRFAQTAGMSSRDFVKAFEDDPAQAFAAFTAGLDQINKSGGDVFTLLDDLGLSDIRVSRALLSMASSGDLLTESLELGARAWEENTALTDEYGRRLDTAAAQVDIAWNNIRDAGIEAGEVLLPVIESVANGVSDAAQAFAGLPDPVQDATTGLLGIVAVLGGGGFFAAKTIQGIANTRESLQALGIESQRTGRIMRTALTGTAILAGIEIVDAALEGLYDKKFDGSNLDRSLEALASGRIVGEIQDKYGKDLQGFGEEAELATSKITGLNRAVSDVPVIGGFLSGDWLPGKSTQSAVENLAALDAQLATLVETGNEAAAAQIFEQLEAAAADAGVSGKDLASQFSEYGIALDNVAPAADDAASATEGLAGANEKSESAASAATAQTEAQIEALNEQREAARETASSFVGLGDSLDDSKVSLGDWVAEMEAQAQALRDFTKNARTAARRGLDEGLIASLEEAGETGALRMDQLAGATEAEIRRANRAWRRGQRAIEDYETYKVNPKNVEVRGAVRAQRQLAGLQATMDSLPPSVESKIRAEGVPKTEGDVDRLIEKYPTLEKHRKALISLIDKASGPAARLGAALDAAARDRQATITLNRVENTYRNVISGTHDYYGNKRNPADGGTIPFDGGSPRRAAWGETVPDDGGGYFDKFPYLLAPLEEVVSNRHGQAEEFRPELKAINAGASRAEVIALMARGLADGGTVGLAGGGTTGRNDSQDGIRELGNAARETAKQMREAARAERERIRDLKRSLVDTVSDKFRSNIFQNDNPWSAGGDWRSQLRTETAQARQFTRDTHTLKNKGVKGGALDYLLTNADPSMVRGFAGMSKKELAEYSRLYTARERAAGAAGRTAGNAAYGAQLKAIERQLDRLNQRIGKSAEETGRAVGREINGAARNGARRGGR